ncbi:hypothetical protein J437_LFUL004091 [Ladona fulva]|uniref:Cadherin domain-containing protein n=1 Tax=Ladona fulva TaxID=123851 RepID=A0A8K0NW94_LADFU|nr:hypothetical protein J437_LFUL004091 [Ladona fulva]
MGRPSLSSTLTVYFNVVDLNDNAPLFDPMSYSNEIFENVTVGTSVVAVSATDLDSGDNGRIVYSIASGDESGDFDIAANGSIFTRHPLDRETRSLYSLVVVATDRADPPEARLSSTVQVSKQQQVLGRQQPCCATLTPICTTGDSSPWRNSYHKKYELPE